MKCEKAINLEEFEAYLKKKIGKTSVPSYLYHFKKLLKERGFSSYEEIAENIDVLVNEYNTGGKYEDENLRSSRTYHAVLKKFKDFLKELEEKTQTNLREDRLQNKDNSKQNTNILKRRKICYLVILWNCGKGFMRRKGNFALQRVLKLIWKKFCNLWHRLSLWNITMVNMQIVLQNTV